MKKILVAILILTMSLTLGACGSNKKNASEVTIVTEETEKNAETGTPEYEKVAVGNKISTDFVEMTIAESGITNSLKTSIKKDNITRTFGPEDSEETDFAFIKGTIMNKSTSSIGKEILSDAKVGDYTLEEDNLYIYKSDGETVWELSPLVEYNFMMCVEIPNALVSGMESCDLNFAFNEGMSSTTSEFEKMEYKYSLTITPDAPTAPEPETAE